MEDAFCITSPYEATLHITSGSIYKIFFSLNKLSNKQSICQWFEMQWCSCDIKLIL